MGKLKSTKKKAEFTPGVDSLKRSVLASPGSTAQFPDCCRLIEAIFIRLCRLHKSPKKRGQGSVSRWTLILDSYSTIRSLIHNNGAIMQDTGLQLINVNLTTLRTWYNQRGKRQDVSLLLQGINLPPRLPLASEPLPPANVRPAAAVPLRPLLPSASHPAAVPLWPLRPLLPSASHPAAVTQQSVHAQGHVQAHKRQAVVPLPAVIPPVRPRLAAQRQIFPKPPPASGPVIFSQAPIIYPQFPTTAPPGIPVPPPIPTVFAVPFPPIDPLAPSAPLPPPASSRPSKARFNKRKVESNSCRKCGQFRTKATGHSQYRGTIYCPNTETLSLKDWLEQIKKV